MVALSTQFSAGLSSCRSLQAETKRRFFVSERRDGFCSVVDAAFGACCPPSVVSAIVQQLLYKKERAELELYEGMRE